MGKKLLIASIVLILILVAIFGRLYITQNTENEISSAVQPKYHLKIIQRDSGTFFSTMFEKGAVEAAEKLGVFVELEEVEGFGENALADSVKIAIYSGVDAVAFQSNDQELTDELYQQASDNDVEIMLYESENFSNATVQAAGSNSYSVGINAGKLALEATDGECKAILVMNQAEENTTNTYKNMKLQGILETFGDDENYTIVETLTVGDDFLDGEELASTLIGLQNSYNCIICLHEKTTPLIAQRVIDSGLLSNVKIVGYGALPQTLDYIERDVIYGSICPDAEDIGRKTISMMYSKLNQEMINDYSSALLFTITKENVAEFNSLWTGDADE